MKETGICDEIVFKSIYLKWNKPLQHFLQARGLDLEMAADKVQDCFVRLWNNCSKITEEKAKSYLFTSATNLQIDQFRKSKVRLKYLEQLGEKVSFMDGQYQMEHDEFKAKLEAVISAMPQKSKEVFMMSRFSDMSYKEISEAIGIGVKAVEKRMSIALAHLAKQNILKKR